MAATPEILLTRGYEARREHRLDDARRVFSEAVDLCRKSNNRSGLAQALAGLAQIDSDQHDEDGARLHYEQAVAVCRTLDDPLRVAHTVRHLGDILRKQGQGVSSESCYSEALEIYRKSQETPLLDLANTLRGFALLKGENGEAEEARSLWREARDLYAALNIQAGVDEGNRRISLLSQA